MMKDIIFRNPEFFWLLALLPVVAAWMIWKRRRQDAYLQLSSVSGLKFVSPSLRARLRPLLAVLHIAAFVLLVTAMARPQNQLSEEKITSEGIDIVMTLDISSSMLAEDFSPNRLDASRAVAEEFVDKRPADRIGLVVFAGESFTQCPITTDHAVVKKMIHETQCGIVEDGTAIGMGLATAVNRLRDSEAKSRVIILLTDGENNAGFVDPLTAAEAAAQFGIRVYTIGVGTLKGRAPMPDRNIFGMQQYVEVKIDEPLLKQIAKLTDGRYFRASNNNKLREIYEEIDRMEKSKIEVTSFLRYTEQFRRFAVWATLLLALEWILRFTWFRSMI